MLRLRPLKVQLTEIVLRMTVLRTVTVVHGEGRSYLAIVFMQNKYETRQSLELCYKNISEQF